jgi:hypothetical protein
VEPKPEPKPTSASATPQTTPEREPLIDLASKTKAELEKLAEGLEVQGTGKDGFVTKEDLLRAVSGGYLRRDLRAEG